MKIEEYIESLPKSIISGEEVQLPESSIRKIFQFVKLNENDIFYHLGCGNANGIAIASKEFHVKNATGIDIDNVKVQNAKKELTENNVVNGKIICEDIIQSDLENATVILFWFTDVEIIEKMMKKFEKLQNGCKIITIWGPLPNCFPSKVDFPFIINETPLKQTADLKEQLIATFGVKCIDFVTAWEYAERYTKAISAEDSENDRFLTILQTLVIWINARNLELTCDKEMPESIRTYIGILRNYFGIEVEHLLDKN